ncbi:MAG: trypsin-like peptidase domain-containing protein [Lachnospiraceae bacterium]|nr:trypsin-like peptidase domain-containing protein [Lachnospiraceae bacterium]
MRNNKKKPSVFKNILIITGCTMFAALYMMTIRVCVDNVTYEKTGNSITIERFDAEKDTLPAWSDKVETQEEPNEDTIKQKPRRRGDSKDTKEEALEAETTQEPEADETEEIEEDTKEKVKEEAKEEAENEETQDTDSKTEKKKQSAVKVGNVQTVQQASSTYAVVTDVTEVVKAAMPCVVAITNEYTAYDFWYDEEYEDEANGSGIVISQNDEELLILTNYHVVEDANDLYVKFIDNLEVMAYTKGTAPEEDLAVVSVFLEDIPDSTLEEIAIAALGNSDALDVGEPAIAIGNSLGYGQSVTTGVISALNCDIFADDEDITLDSLIQTDAAINPGNSGGALLNVKGEVIGINSSKIADYAIEGMGYAIPINTAKPIVDELVKKETRRKVDEEKRAFLGISGSDVSDEAVSVYDMPEGVYVSSVLKRSAAAEAGLQKGDIITAIDDEKVTSMSKLQDILDYYEAGAKAELTFMRIEDGDYEEWQVTVTFGLKEE